MEIFFFSNSIIETCFYFVFNRSDYSSFLYLPTENNKLFVQDLLTLPCVHLSFLKYLLAALFTHVSTGEMVLQRTVKVLLVYCLL